MGRRKPYPYDSWDESDEELYTQEDDYQGDDYYEQPRRYRHPRRRRKQRRVWPALLMGCGLGIFLVVVAAGVVVFLAARSAQNLSPTGGLGGIGNIGNTTQFTQSNTQPVQLSTLTQLQVCNKIGDVNITTGTDNAITIAAQKIVHASSQANADQEFGRITVAAQSFTATSTLPTCASASSIGTPSTTSSPTTNQGNANALVVTTSIPDNQGMFRGTNDAVNLTLTIPASLINPDNSLSLVVNAPVGNISVKGVSGNLQIKGSSGNITVNQGVLAIGSHIETGQGNVLFSGALAEPASGTTSTNGSLRYLLQAEQGNIDVTLPATTVTKIDANTNVGTITSNDFHLATQSSQGGMSYQGPLTTTATTPATTLILDVSTGNVTLHQATT